MNLTEIKDINLKELDKNWDFEDLENIAKDSSMSKEDKIKFLTSQKNCTRYEYCKYFNTWGDYYALSEYQRDRVQKIIDTI